MNFKVFLLIWKQTFYVLEIVLLSFHSMQWDFFLTATWLPNGQLWVTVEGAALLTRCK